MPVSSAFLEFSCDLFDGLGEVSSRRMFGGAGLYARGVMFALIADDTIYLKAKGQLASDLTEEGSEPFVFESKRGAMAMSYYRLPEAGLDDPDEALRWGARALDLALSSKA